LNKAAELPQRWRARLSPLGINVNAIAPGYFPDQDDCASIRTRRRRWRPMKRGGGPKDLKGVRALVTLRRLRLLPARRCRSTVGHGDLKR